MFTSRLCLSVNIEDASPTRIQRSHVHNGIPQPPLETKATCQLAGRLHSVPAYTTEPTSPHVRSSRASSICVSLPLREPPLRGRHPCITSQLLTFPPTRSDMRFGPWDESGLLIQRASDLRRVARVWVLCYCLTFHHVMGRRGGARHG